MEKLVEEENAKKLCQYLKVVMHLLCRPDALSRTPRYALIFFSILRISYTRSERPPTTPYWWNGEADSTRKKVLAP
jgi:hypothetical protein